MITLQEILERRYTKDQLEEFKTEVVTNKNRNAEYLISNLQAFRLLGWELKLGTRLNHEFMVEYWKVLKYDSQLYPRSMRLYVPPKKKGGVNSANNKRTRNT